VPVLNSRGDIAAGVGDGTVSINNNPIAEGGAACWLDDDHVVFNGLDKTGRWALQLYDVRTGACRTLNGDGANSIAAGGGRFAAQAGALTYASFSFSLGSVMSLTSTDGRGASSADGLIALCNDPSCTSFTIYAPDGTSYSIPEAAYGLCLLGPMKATWDGGAFGYSLKTPVPMTRQRVVRVDGEDWIVGYAKDIGIVAVPNGAFDGYVLEAREIAFHHDARNIGGQLVMCWAGDVSESPGSNVVTLVDRSLPRVRIAPPVTIPTYPAARPYRSRTL
jgi:hypothetical protein